MNLGAFELYAESDTYVNLLWKSFKEIFDNAELTKKTEDVSISSIEKIKKCMKNRVQKPLFSFQKRNRNFYYLKTLTQQLNDLDIFTGKNEVRKKEFN